MEGVEQKETPQTKDDHEVNGDPAAKRKKNTKTTCLEEAVTKLTDSVGAQKTPSNEESLKAARAKGRGKGSKY